MLVSLKEISKYVDIKDLSAEEIADRLTYSGIEVEEIKKVADATNLIIGKVISCEKHPESDHLHVCKVDIKKEILDIVCGAPNCREGLKVIVAQNGAVLNGKEIKKSEIRGYVSNGMLCALNELGVDPKTLRKEQIEGIEELPEDAEIGNENVLEYLSLDDTILDISLLANRSDCLSLYNVAREIGALFNRKCIIPNYEEVKTYNENNFLISSESENCKSFYAKILKGIEIKESPKWLKDVLRSEGIRSINNIVDAGNYAMLLTGQPVHCYDLDNLPKKELIVKDNIEEDFYALDEKIYHIISGDLCVTSDNKTMCLGGILGGEKSEINPNSKNILIEVANFDFAQIRKTSNRLGLSSDSSMRFSKGINKDQSEFVINTLVHLIKEVSNIKEISSIIKYDKLNHDAKKIDCSISYINNRLGSKFTFEEIKNVLECLNFKLTKIDEDCFNVIVPSYRIDVEGKADLSEEIIRYKGFDYISNSLPVMETTLGTLSKEREKEKYIEEYLLNNGLYEVLTYTLINKKDSEMLNYINSDEIIPIANPLTEDHKFIRKNILSSILRCAEYNLNHQQENFSLFEISNVYSKNKEEKHLAIVLEGYNLGIDSTPINKKDFYDLKGYFESILKMFNIAENRIKYQPIEESNEFHIGRSAKVTLDGKVLCVFGEIHPNLKKEFSIKKDNVLMLEMNLTLLFNTKSANNKFNEISKYPSVKRDYAFVISNDCSYSNIKIDIKKISSLIKNIKVFDVYHGEGIEKNHTSIALSIYLESTNSTLKEEDITLVDNKIKELLITKYKAKLRG